MSESIVTCTGLLESNQLKEDHKKKERRKRRKKKRISGREKFVYWISSKNKFTWDKILQGEYRSFSTQESGSQGYDTHLMRQMENLRKPLEIVW